MNAAAVNALAYKPVVTVIDVLETGACLDGVLAFVKKHGGIIAANASDFPRESHIQRAAYGYGGDGDGGDGDGDGDGGDGGYGDGGDGDGGDGYGGYGDGDGYGDAYGDGDGYGDAYANDNRPQAIVAAEAGVAIVTVAKWRAKYRGQTS